MKKFFLLLIVIFLFRITLFIFLESKPNIITSDPIRETSIFTNIKNHIKQTYSANLSGDQANLLMGIVFGEKSDKQANKLYAATGVLHVVAASGMNVSMFTSFLLTFLLLFLRRQYSLIVTVGFIIFYAALAEFQPSIVRASIMAFFALGAGLSGRQNTSLLALFFAAFLMGMWDPTVLASISFILSFTATLGIILLDPVLKSYLRKDYLEDFRTTLAAQIATTPILLFFFGSYSPISILTNLLVLWTVPPLMMIGGIAALFSFISPLAAAPFVLLSMPLLSYFIYVINFLSKFAFQIHSTSVPWVLILGYYLILLGLIFIWEKKYKSVK